MAQTSIITGQYVRINQAAATLLQRCLAWILDSIAIWIAGGTLMTVAIGFLAGIEASNEAVIIIVLLVCMLPLMGYPLFMEYFFNGQSLGKMVMRIRVVSLDGSRPSAMALMLRWLLLMIDMSLGAGLVSIIFTKNSQRLGDLAAGTTVVTLSRKNDPLIHLNSQFARNDYRPTYPEVTRLTMRQVEVIEKVLFSSHDANHMEYIFTISRKLEGMLGIKPLNHNLEQFVSTVYNDYQFYSTRVI